MTKKTEMNKIVLRACSLALFLLQSMLAIAQQCVFVEDEFLNERVYSSLKTKLKLGEDVCFKNIPGGQAKLLVKYSRLLSGRNVHVYGYCNSLCAALALSADKVILHKTHNSKEPSGMLIHGTFDMSNMEWHPSSLDDVDFYHERLKIIPKKDIEQAISYKKYGPNGLIISSEPWPQLHPSKSLVNVCEDFPKRCRSLKIYDLSKIGIFVEN